MSDIVVLKLITGEEVIAKEVMHELGMMYHQPRVIQMVQTRTGVQAGLVPWILSAPDAEVEINHSQIIARAEPTGDVEDSYLQQTSKIDLTTRIAH